MIERIDLGIAGLTNIERIGSGGNAIVYRARQNDLDRDVVVKVLTNVDADTTRRRFDRERRAMGRLSQASGIAPLYGSGFTPTGQPYLLMPFYEQGSLQERLERAGALEPARVRDLGIAISRGVQTAHENGVLHRDLKPANILIRRSGEPDVADFGIAHLTDDSLGTSQALTMTPLYTAPEVFDGVESGAASDIYSVGATLYALINGHPAYSDPEGGTPVLSLMRRINEDPLPALPPTVPKGLEVVIARAMSKDPAQRQTSAGELAAELAAADMTAPKVRAQRQRRTTGTKRMSSRVVVGAVAVLLAIVGGVAAAFLLIDRSERTTTDPTATAVPGQTPEPEASATQRPTPTPPSPGSVAPFDLVSAKSTAERTLVRIEAFSCTGVDIATGVLLNDGIIITRDDLLQSPWHIDVIAAEEVLPASWQPSMTPDGFAFIEIDAPSSLDEPFGVAVEVGDQVAIVGIDGRPALASIVAGDVEGALRAVVVNAGAGNEIQPVDAIVTDSGGLVGVAAVSPGVIDVVTIAEIEAGTSQPTPSYGCPSFTRDLGPRDAESALSPAIRELLTMQLLSDAFASEDWALVRNLEPGKATLTDQAFVNGWRPLRQGFVYPVERTEQDGLARWRIGLIGHETWNGNDLTTLFCLTWTVDPISGVVAQTNEDNVEIFGSQPGQEQQPGHVSPAELTDLIAERCPL